MSDQKIVEEGMGKELFDKLLADFYSVKIHVVFHPDVKLPDMVKPAGWREGQKTICLEYGLDMPNPIGDLKVGEDGISAVLSFARTPVDTFVPWAAVVAAVGDGLRPKPKMKPSLKLVP